jgi:hypothetical protein
MRGKSFLVLALGLSAIAVAACSSSASTPGSTYGYSYNQSAAGASNSSVSGDNKVANPSAAASAPSEAGQSAGPTTPTSGIGAPEDRVVKTGSINLQVASIDESVVRATDQIHALGGWLAGSDRTTSTASGLASVTYRVPVARFEDALAAMRKLGTKVLGEHSDSASVGSQIVDLQARIDNLKASETAIQAIMVKATAIADVLTVQQRLADVQGQIEQLTAQVQGLSDQSAYSTLTVILEVPAVDSSPSPSPSPSASAVAWSAGEQFNQAAGTLSGVGRDAATVAIWCLVVVLPLTLALVLLIVLFGLAVRLLDPLRRRWLPFGAAQLAPAGQPGGYRQPNWTQHVPAPAPSQSAVASPDAKPASDAPGSEPK